MLEQSSLDAPTTPLPVIDLVRVPSAASALAPRFRVEKELGRGGTGVVYLARDTRIDRAVAIKVLLGGGFAGQVPRQRLLSEATTVARLDHPNIVRLYEVGEFEDVPYLVLEYVSGETLRQRSLRQPFTPTQAAEVVATLARAVEHAHANGVIHRDLKPQNVLLASGPDDALVPKLTDFGIAKRVGEDSDLTGTGVLLGTPVYMAPEQAASRRGAISPRTDVYSLGAILYELLTGRPPYLDLNEDPAQVAMRVILVNPTPPRSVRPTTPPGLEAICLKCLEKSPEQRYPTALQMAEDLDRWLRGEVPTARPPSRFKRVMDRVTTRRFLSATAVLLLVVTTVVLGVLLAFARPVDPPDPQEEIERRLAKGEAVTLIGETGLPTWHRWALGPASLTTSGVYLDGTAAFKPDDYSLLELVSDPMTDRYRLTAEVRDDTPTNAVSDELRTVGLYCGYRHAQLPDVGEVHRFMSIEFADRMLPKDIRPNRPHQHRARAELKTIGRAVNDATAGLESHWFGAVRFDPTENTHDVSEKPFRSWRTITVEVTPEGLEAYWGTKATGVRFGQWSARELDLWSRQWPPFSFPVPVGTPAPDVLGWVPRSPLGVIACGTPVSVRKVVVEPLPDH